MLTSTTLPQLEANLKKFYSQDWIQEVSRKLRSAVVDSSNLEYLLFEPNGLQFRCRTIEEKILLGIFQWFAEPELRCLINLWLEENWGGEHKEIIEVINNSKDTALGYLLVSDRWNDRDFFGNILKTEKFLYFKRSFIRRVNHAAPKRKIRRRGYDDKGTLPSRTNPEPVFDYRKLQTVTEQMNRVAELQEKIHRLYDLIWDRLILENFN